MYTLRKKLPEYPEREGLLLEERVSEAKRLATTVKFCIKLFYLDYLVCISSYKHNKIIMRDFVDGCPI